ncbi:MAG: glycosyltransferase family 4 protein [Candidatus Heimdallarchaeota archaeon]
MSTLPHICYVIWKFKSPQKFLQMGGAEKQLLKIMEFLKDDNSKHMTIITKQTTDDSKEELYSKNKKMIRLKTTNIPILSMLLFMILIFFTIIKINKRSKIDLIHVPLPDIFLISLMLIRKILKIPVITRAAGDELYPFRKHGFWLFNRLVVRALMLKFDGLQVLNLISYNAALKLGFQSNKLFLIPNGTTIPSKYRDYENFTKTIVYIGAMRFYPEKNIKEQKNLLFLIKAFHLLLKSHSDLKLVMVGDGNYRTTLEKLVKDLTLQEKIIFTGYRTEIDEYLLSADIFVNPSWFEGMPNTVIEAMAFGVYLLCSNIPEHRFIIKNNDNGVLFDHSSQEDFVKKVLNFYNNPKKSIQIAKKGHIIAEKKFSINIVCESIFNMYKTVNKHFCGKW